MDVFYGEMPTKINNKIESSEKCIRTILHAKYNTKSEPLFKRCGILNLNDLVSLETIILMAKINAEIAATPLNTMFLRKTEIHSYQTRQHTDFNIYCYSNAKVYKSFLAQGPKLWLNLDKELKQKSIRCIMRNVKEKMLGRYS